MTDRPIRSFADIPDILTMEVPPVEYIVPALGIARNTITLWTGADGDGKTYLAQAMTAAIANGTEFLGVTCQQSPVLYLDLENPAYVVQARMQNIISASDEASYNFVRSSNLKVWGIWNEQAPPPHGTELLLTIAKETRPVILIDPFRYWQRGRERQHRHECSHATVPRTSSLRLRRHSPAPSFKGRRQYRPRQFCDSRRL